MTPGNTDHTQAIAAYRTRPDIRRQAHQPPACRNCAQRSGTIVPMTEGPVIRLTDYTNAGPDTTGPDEQRFGDYRVWTCPTCGRVVLDSQVQDDPYP